MADLDELRAQVLEARKRKRPEPLDDSTAPDSRRLRQSPDATSAAVAASGETMDISMDPADFEEGEISEESEDESEAVAAMIIVPRLQQKAAASQDSLPPTPPVAQERSQIQHYPPSAGLHQFERDQSYEPPYTATTPLYYPNDDSHSLAARMQPTWSEQTAASDTATGMSHFPSRRFS